MIFRCLELTTVNQMMERLVAELKRSFPADKVSDAESLSRSLPRISEIIRRQLNDNMNYGRLNIYQKAKYGLKLQEALQEAGYSRSFSKSISREAVMSLALAQVKSN